MNKKLLLSLGGISVAIAPIAAVVSCGGNKTTSNSEAPKEVTKNSEVDIELLKTTAKDELINLVPTLDYSIAPAIVKTVHNLVTPLISTANAEIDNSTSQSEIDVAKNRYIDQLKKYGDILTYYIEASKGQHDELQGLQWNQKEEITKLMAPDHMDFYQLLGSSSFSDFCGDSYTKYNFTLPDSNHSVSIFVSTNNHINEADIKRAINIWLTNSNWGYGMLTLNEIYITTRIIGNNPQTGGVGGSARKMILKMPSLQNVSDYDKDFQLQTMLLNLFHEYGHHETTSLVNSHGITQVQDSVSANTFSFDIAAKATSNPGLVASQMKTTFTGKNLEDYYSKFYGEQNPNAIYAADFTADDLSYTFNPLESLNRPMNVLEFSPWNWNRTEAFYQYWDLLKYELGSERKIVNDDGSFTDEAQKMTIDYGKNVYGWSSYGLKYTPYGVKGYSDIDFDFMIGYNANGTVLGSAKTEKIKSHFITRDNMFGKTRIVHGGYAYRATYEGYDPMSWFNCASRADFFKDTNGNGIYDDGVDQRVDIDLPASASDLE